MIKRLFILLSLLFSMVSFSYALYGDDLILTYNFENDCLNDLGSYTCSTGGTYVSYGAQFGSYALNTNGSGFSATVYSTPDQFFGGSYTISIWVQNVASWANDKWILEGNSAVYSNYWFALYTNGSGVLYFDMYDGPANGGHNPSISGGSINDDDRHNIVIRRNTSDCTMEMFLDGSSVASGTDTTCSATNIYNLQLSFGSRYDNSQYFTGSIDGLYFWQRPLDDTEITTTTWNSGSGTECPIDCPEGGPAPTPPPDLPDFPSFDDTIYNSCISTSSLFNFNIACYATTTFAYLFSFDTSYIGSSTAYLTYTIAHKFPIGYVTNIVEIMSTTTEGTLTILSAQVPATFGFGTPTLTLDISHVFDFVLYATTSQFNNASASSTETFFEITNGYWKILLYVLVILYILRRLFPSTFTGVVDDFAPRRFEGAQKDLSRIRNPDNIRTNWNKIKIKPRKS